jgi:hypothetical protein
MVEIKAGDRVVCEVDQKTYDVLAVEGESLWIRDPLKIGAPFTVHAEYFTKVEPFFEVGKTYRNATFYMDGYQHFEVLGVHERNGSKVAFGWRGHKAQEWDYNHSFDGWEEV